MLVTLLFMPPPRGRNVALIGSGGGASVLITDEFEKSGLKVPSLPQEIRNRIREFTPAAGNILRNPIDYSQTITEAEKLVETARIVYQWEGIDFVIGFLRPSQAPPSARGRTALIAEAMLEMSKIASKPTAIVFEPSILPEETREIFSLIQKFVSSGLPVYYSFTSAANAISLLLRYKGASRAN